MTKKVRTGRDSKKLTHLQRKAIVEKLKGKTDSRAARDAGYSPATAHRASIDVFGKPVVQAKFAEIMERAGITDELLAQRLREGLDAKETKFFAHKGVVKGKRTVVANSERRLTAELVCKIKQHIPKDTEPPRAPIQVQLIHVAGDVYAASSTPPAQAVEVIEVGR
jgi:phage terminase small subunit